jgi:hypothetical protein
MTVQDVLDGTRMDFKTQLQQFTLDLVVVHVWILPRHSDNQRLYIVLHSWPPTATRVLERPFPADKLAVPFQHRVRLDEQNRFASYLMKAPCLCVQPIGEGDEPELFGTRQARLGFGFTFEDPELLPKESNLEIFFSRRHSD